MTKGEGCGMRVNASCGARLKSSECEGWQGEDKMRVLFMYVWLGLNILSAPRGSLTNCNEFERMKTI